MVGRRIKCRRFVIDVTGLDLPSLGELGGFQNFGESGASRRARAKNIGKRVRDVHKLTL